MIGIGGGNKTQDTKRGPPGYLLQDCCAAAERRHSSRPVVTSDGEAKPFSVSKIQAKKGPGSGRAKIEPKEEREGPGSINGSTRECH